MNSQLSSALLIGVDGGATEAKAHAVVCRVTGQGTAFTLRPEAAGRVYPRVAAFTPLPVADQLMQRDMGKIAPTPAEVEQGALWITAAAHAIVAVARRCHAARVLVGIGMPGLKTADGRGICVLNNGPRMPRYLDVLTERLAAAGVALAAPIAALGSDADYCGLGEEHAADGLFRDVQHAYYCGGGTGIADALKLHGRLIPFDTAKSWIQKSWQMPSALGPPFEKLVSAAALNRLWHDLTTGGEGEAPAEPKSGEVQAPAEPKSGEGEAPAEPKAPAEPPAAPAPPPYPELAAAAGHRLALSLLDTTALVLAELLFERLWTVKNGRADAPHRGLAYAALARAHTFRGTILDRIIIGQRIGRIYGDPALRSLFADRVERCLAALIADSGDVELVAAWLAPHTTPPLLQPGRIRASRLRAAPALGAAVAAVRALPT
ncbi:MAG: hypothetical protein AB1716_07755 [Planctomycetota bacterium]